MTEKRFKYTFEGIEDTLESDEEYKYTLCNKDGFQDLCEMLNKLHEENLLLKEKEKYILSYLKKEYDYVYNQRMKHLDDAVLVTCYELIEYHIRSMIEHLKGL